MFIKLLLFLPLVLGGFSENGKEPWGCDAELVGKKEEMQVIEKNTLIVRACTASIRFFQNYISPIDGPRSSFYPSSSEYTRLMILRYGALRGITMGCDRLMRENHEDWVYRVVHKDNRVLKSDLLE